MNGKKPSFIVRSPSNPNFIDRIELSRIVRPAGNLRLAQDIGTAKEPVHLFRKTTICFHDQDYVARCGKNIAKGVCWRRCKRDTALLAEDVVAGMCN